MTQRPFYTGDHAYDGEGVPFPEPSLPYAGTSGYSGTETSKQRQEKNDASGKTGKVQRDISRYALDRGHEGITIKDVRKRFPEEHHGTLSGALTQLHHGGRLARLTEVRERCTIYVAPRDVLGRETIDPPKRVKREVIEADRDEVRSCSLGDRVLDALHNGVDEVVVRWVK